MFSRFFLVSEKFSLNSFELCFKSGRGIDTTSMEDAGGDSGGGMLHSRFRVKRGAAPAVPLYADLFTIVIYEIVDLSARLL